MKGRRPLSLLFMTLLFSTFFFIQTSADHNPHHHANDDDDDGCSTTRIELIHRHSPKLNPNPLSPLERIKDLVLADIVRQNMISHQLFPNTNTNTNANANANANASLARRQTRQSSNMPITTGKARGIGMYLVELQVGTPPQSMLLIMDTSSPLTWLNCEKNRQQKPYLRAGEKRVFHPERSSSYQKNICGTPLCQYDFFQLHSLRYCPKPRHPCLFDFGHLDGTKVKGYLGNETVSITLANGRKAKLRNIPIGCATKVEGEQSQQADGILGLAYHNYAFGNKAAQRFGGKFSYCLMDHLLENVSNYLTFGRNKKALLSRPMQYTRFEIYNKFYGVHLKGISVNGVMLNIPADTWDYKCEGDPGAYDFRCKGGLLVESGVSLTYLLDPAYTVVTKALLAGPLSRLAKDQVDGVPIEHCFNSRGFDESMVPQLAFHFRDGAVFEPPKKSYVIDVSSYVKCLGFSPPVGTDFGWVTNNIGNLMQQNHLWEFDLVQRRLGFAPSDCT